MERYHQHPPYRTIKVCQSSKRCWRVNSVHQRCTFGVRVETRLKFVMPNIRGIGIVGNTVPLQGTVTGSNPVSSTKFFTALVQLNRISGYEPEGREFESLRRCQVSLAGVMATCRSPKPLIGVRIPGGAPRFFCGYNSMVEYLAFNQEVGGFESPCPYQIWLVSIVRSIAPACHAGGQGFESPTGRQVCRGVWKWSSTWFHKPRIVGSNPTTATSFRILSAYI